MGASRRLLLVVMLVAAIALGSLMGSIQRGRPTQILEGPQLLVFLFTLLRYMILAATLGLTLFMVYYRKTIVEELKKLLLYFAQRRKRRWSSWKLSLLTLLAIYAALALLFLFRVGPMSEEPTSTVVATYTGLTTRTTASGGTGTARKTSPSLIPYPDTIYTVAIVLSMVATVLAAGVIIVQSLIRAREEAVSIEKDRERSEEVVEAIRESVFELESSLSCREAIVRCYKRFCELLTSRGLPIPDHQTAREFRKLAARILRLPKEPLEGLTELFEEARYSLHEMTIREREEALKHLRDLENHLLFNRGP